MEKDPQSKVEQAALELSELQKLASAGSAHYKRYFDSFLQTFYEVDKASRITLGESANLLNDFYSACGNSADQESNADARRAVLIKGGVFIYINGGARRFYDDIFPEQERTFFQHSSLMRVRHKCDNLLLSYEHRHPYLSPVTISDGHEFELLVYNQQQNSSFISSIATVPNSSSRYLRLQYAEKESNINTVIRILPDQKAEFQVLPKKPF